MTYGRTIPKIKTLSRKLNFIETGQCVDSSHMVSCKNTKQKSSDKKITNGNYTNW